MSDREPVIEINQDQEFDENSGELGGPMNVFWAHGHDHNADEFIRAVVDHCLGWAGETPAIRSDDAPHLLWQRNVEHCDSLEYQRQSDPPNHREWIPVTVLDLERRGYGGTKCSVDGCKEPWASGQPVRVSVDNTGDYMAVRLWLCREHSARFPGPSYRISMIPVGATILLPNPSEVGE